MSVTQYIGARYVPLFADPIEWSNTRAYEPLTIVTYEGNSYTSKQATPIGIEIDNTDYWALTGNYNAQVEAYRQEVTQISTDLNNKVDGAVDEFNTFTEGKAYYNGDAAASVVAADDFIKIGVCDIPDGHTCQGSAVYDGYLYLTHHKRDAAMLYLAKYSYPSLNKVDEIEISAGMHANGIAVDRHRKTLYITDTQTRSLTLIDLIAFEKIGSVTHEGATYSAIAFKTDGTKCAVMPSGNLAYYIFGNYQNKFDNFTGMYMTDVITNGNTLKQDADGSNTFIYQLCSNQNSQKYNAQMIAITGWNGAIFKNLYLPNTENELEGITRLSEDGKFVITDVYGGVYEATPDAQQIYSAWFGQGIATYRNGINTRYTPTTPTSFLSSAELPNPKLNLVTKIQMPFATDAGFPSGRYVGLVNCRVNGSLCVGSITNGGAIRIRDNIITNTKCFTAQVDYNIDNANGFIWLRVLRMFSPKDDNKIANLVINQTDTENDINQKIITFWSYIENNMPELWNEVSNTETTFLIFDAISNGEMTPFSWHILPTKYSDYLN